MQKYSLVQFTTNTHAALATPAPLQQSQHRDSVEIVPEVSNCQVDTALVNAFAIWSSELIKTIRQLLCCPFMNEMKVYLIMFSPSMEDRIWQQILSPQVITP